MEAIIQRHIDTEKCDMELVLSAGSPTDMFAYLEKQFVKGGLYFLDVDLQHEIHGIALAANIRDMDTSAAIVFITTHAELSYLVFTHKIEAMDYILKDKPEEMEERVLECLRVAYKRRLHDKTLRRKPFIIKTGDQVLNIPHDEILFFETHPAVRNKLILHMENRLVEFRGFISDVAKIDPAFYRCHQSFVVNTTKIKGVDKKNNEINMINGEIVPITIRKMSELLKLME